MGRSLSQLASQSAVPLMLVETSIIMRRSSRGRGMAMVLTAGWPAIFRTRWLILDSSREAMQGRKKDCDGWSVYKERAAVCWYRSERVGI